jgi:ABC-2 type transport system ATP-binding protein
MMIQVDNLSKYYGSTAAIENVSFQVDRGEILGLFGPKGAGKTTLMRILAAYVPPSEGVATVAGYDVFAHSLEVRRRVGYLPEAVSFYAGMTVWDYLNFVAALHRVKQRVGCVEAALDKVKLSDYSSTLIGRLPQGVRRRVGVAQAIVHNPDVLILDEPTAGLDPTDIVDINRLIKSLDGEQTVIFSSRSLSEMERICSRVLMLKNGRVVAQDTPHRLVCRLEGGQTVWLQIASAPANAMAALRSLEGINKVWQVQPGVFEIECVCGVDCRPAIANLVVQQAWELLELRTLNLDLDHILVELDTDLQLPV